jgi:hypothetical protein
MLAKTKLIQAQTDYRHKLGNYIDFCLRVKKLRAQYGQKLAQKKRALGLRWFEELPKEERLFFKTNPSEQNKTHHAR